VMAERPDDQTTTQPPITNSESFIDTEIPAPNAPPIIIDVRSLLQPKTL
jgi:hypothetical protein